MQYCIEHDKFEQLLAYLFSDSNFAKVLKGLTRREIEELHSTIINTTIEKINGILYFGGHELVFLGNNILIKEISTDIEIAIPDITKIDREYIVDISNRALIDIDNGNFDSAITKSRTLLEEVFCYVIELQKEIPTESGDINKLYQQAKSLYNMHQNSQLDKRINMLLSGLEKILKAISEMRNKDSDAHGVGNKRIKIEKHHAQLFVNASMTMSEFMLAVAEKTKITI